MKYEIPKVSLMSSANYDMMDDSSVQKYLAELIKTDEFKLIIDDIESMPIGTEFYLDLESMTNDEINALILICDEAEFELNLIEKSGTRTYQYTRI